MSSNQNREKNVDEQMTTKDEETECNEGGLGRIMDEEEREGQIQTEQNDEENGGWRRIPVTLTTIKEEDKIPTQEEPKKNNKVSKETSPPLKNKTKKETAEKEVDIVEVPKFPETAPKHEVPSSAKPRYREESCCGYGDGRMPCCRYGNQGSGCCSLSPLPLPSLAYPAMFMSMCPPMGLYSPGMSNVFAGPGPSCGLGCIAGPGPSCGLGCNHGGCCHRRESPPRCCHYDYQGQALNHTDGCKNDRQYCQRDDDDDDYIAHTRGDDRGNNPDDADDQKSVEELLEDYLEDIDEKTELIHEILDEYEAMDLFISVLGFQPEEVHVTAKGRTVTVKGDHQYSEATWVRVRNFSECYEIPEEFDVSRTTAMLTEDTLCVRIPHINGE